LLSEALILDCRLRISYVFKVKCISGRVLGIADQVYQRGALGKKAQN